MDCCTNKIIYTEDRGCFKFLPSGGLNEWVLWCDGFLLICASNAGAGMVNQIVGYPLGCEFEILPVEFLCLPYPACFADNLPTEFTRLQ